MIMAMMKEKSKRGSLRRLVRIIHYPRIVPWDTSLDYSIDADESEIGLALYRPTEASFSLVPE
jgi:hypothetical protein